MRRIAAMAAVLFVVVGPDLAAGPAHWPAWRGPDGTGAGDTTGICLSMDGTCAVLKRGKKLEVVATNKIDEEFSASPAVAAGDLFLRGDKHLYCSGTN